MAGHSKWAQIKRQKGANDAKRSRAFGKLGRFIAVEARKAHGDRNAPGLRTAIEKAKSINMPSDTIDRAIEKATSAGNAEMESIMYEAYGPGGVAMLIDTLTDSRNRTNQEIKHALSKNGATQAAPGAASWAFTKTESGYEPIAPVELSDTELETLSSLVDALEELDDVQNVYTNAS